MYEYYEVMTTDEEIKKIVKEAYDYQKEQKKIQGQKENIWITIFIAGMVVAATIGLAYVQVSEDKNNTNLSHTALSYMSCNELKSLMLEVNKDHANDNLYSYAITDISNEIQGKC